MRVYNHSIGIIAPCLHIIFMSLLLCAAGLSGLALLVLCALELKQGAKIAICFSITWIILDNLDFKPDHDCE